MTPSLSSSIPLPGAIGGIGDCDPARDFDFEVVRHDPAFAVCERLAKSRRILNVCYTEGQAFALDGAPPSSSIVVPEGAIAAKLWRPGVNVYVWYYRMVNGAEVRYLRLVPCPEQRNFCVFLTREDVALEEPRLVNGFLTI